MRRETLRKVSRIVISLGLAMTAWATALDFVDDDAIAPSDARGEISAIAPDTAAYAANAMPSSSESAAVRVQ